MCLNVGGDILIGDEAAEMDMSTFYEVVVPLMELDEVALLCTSTIKDGDNFYSKALNMKDASTGKDFFKKVTFGATPRFEP